jgi:hypothetical protein
VCLATLLISWEPISGLNAPYREFDIELDMHGGQAEKRARRCRAGYIRKKRYCRPELNED